MIERGFLNPVKAAANFGRAKVFHHSGSGFCAIGAETRENQDHFIHFYRGCGIDG